MLSCAQSSCVWLCDSVFLSFQRYCCRSSGVNNTHTCISFAAELEIEVLTAICCHISCASHNLVVMIRCIARRALQHTGQLRDGISTASARSASVQPVSKALNLDEFDPTQVQLLEEQCILVDEQDRVLGSGSKKDCHLLENINKGQLHRAFSVLLFNSKDELLLQQRSEAKITFPGLFTNTCCSHPLYVPEELEQEKAMGVKRAAQRRLQIELGINPEEIPLDQFHYLTRFIYKAPSDSVWGENELDYILLVQKDVTLKPNPNEVKESFYISRKDMLPFLDSLKGRGQQITPWFKLLVDNFLFQWWDNLQHLKKFENHKEIHKLYEKSA